MALFHSLLSLNMVPLIDNRILWLELYKAENTIHEYLLVHYFTLLLWLL